MYRMTKEEELQCMLDAANSECKYLNKKFNKLKGRMGGMKAKDNKTIAELQERVKYLESRVKPIDELEERIKHLENELKAKELDFNKEKTKLQRNLRYYKKCSDLYKEDSTNYKRLTYQILRKNNGTINGKPIEEAITEVRNSCYKAYIEARDNLKKSEAAFKNWEEINQKICDIAIMDSKIQRYVA